MTSGLAERTDSGTPSPRPTHRLRRAVALAAVLVVFGTLGAGFGVHLATEHAPMSTTELMGLSRVPTHPAPSFTLTDQQGTSRSLTSFRGKVVVLYFMDDRCTDVCPLVAQEFIEADHHLGQAARHVAFVGVEVNPNFTAERWVRRFDRAHGLNKLPNWYYLSGSLATLRQVWQSYSITVQVVPKNLNVLHSTVMDFIDPQGHERAMAVPGALITKKGTGYLPGNELERWGQGIAREVRRLLPSRGSPS